MKDNVCTNKRKERPEEMATRVPTNEGEQEYRQNNVGDKCQ